MKEIKRTKSLRAQHIVLNWRVKSGFRLSRHTFPINYTYNICLKHTSDAAGDVYQKPKVGLYGNLARVANKMLFQAHKNGEGSEGLPCANKY